MVSIRLQRIGRKKMPHFRLIAQDKQKNPNDKSLEILGSINPRTKEINLKEENIKAWLAKGAQPTNSVHNLLVDKNIIKADKVKTILISKKRLAEIEKKKEEKRKEDDKVKEVKAKVEKPEEKNGKEKKNK